MPSKGFLISVSNPFLLKTGSHTLPTVNTGRSEFGWRGRGPSLPMAAEPSQARPGLWLRTAQAPPGGPRAQVDSARPRATAQVTLPKEGCTLPVTCSGPSYSPSSARIRDPTVTLGELSSPAPRPCCCSSALDL